MNIENLLNVANNGEKFLEIIKNEEITFDELKKEIDNMKYIINCEDENYIIYDDQFFCINYLKLLIEENSDMNYVQEKFDIAIKAYKSFETIDDNFLKVIQNTASLLNLNIVKTLTTKKLKFVINNSPDTIVYPKELLISYSPLYFMNKYFVWPIQIFKHFIEETPKMIAEYLLIECLTYDQVFELAQYCNVDSETMLQYKISKSIERYIVHKEMTKLLNKLLILTKNK